MSDSFDSYTITDETNIEIEGGEITNEEHDLLKAHGAVYVSGYKTKTGEVNDLQINASKLAQLAFECDLLDTVASTIEVEIMREFRQSEYRKLTTQEITAAVERPKPSVSRALKRLTEKDKIAKVQDGVYRY